MGEELARPLKGCAMRPKRVVWIALGSLLLPAMSHGNDADPLVDLVNAYRSAPERCAGEQAPVAGVLAPSKVLNRLRIGASEDLGKALAAAGYRAATATIVAVTGPSSVRHAMTLLEQRFCSALGDRRYTEIGVSHEAETWRIVMARPLVSGHLGDWREAGKAILGLVNEARSKPRSCGDRRFEATTPLTWSEPLAAAARSHSRDMADHDFFSHTDPAGGTVAERAGRQGYRWRSIGENIAAGQGSPQQAVTGWLASPHHCSNIMSPDYADMGAAYATSAQSDMAIYWTQDFGRRQ